MQYIYSSCRLKRTPFLYVNDYGNFKKNFMILLHLFTIGTKLAIILKVYTLYIYKKGRIMTIAYATAQVLVRTIKIANLEWRLMCISEEYNLKYTAGCAQTAIYTNRMNSELDAIRGQLGDDYTSEEYRQMMAECESVENEYTAIIQQIQDQMTLAEQKMQTQQEQVETQLEVLREEKEQWKEVIDDTIERTCSYFTGN